MKEAAVCSNPAFLPIVVSKERHDRDTRKAINVCKERLRHHNLVIGGKDFNL